MYLKDTKKKLENQRCWLQSTEKKGKRKSLSTFGFSHPVVMTDPEGIENRDGRTEHLLSLKGIDKRKKVGQYAAENQRT